MKMEKLKIAILGAGSRGLNAFAPYFPAEKTEIVAVAEPDSYRRNLAAERFHIPAEGIFRDYRDFLKAPKKADAVIITTQDSMHVEPAVACARLGYHILLEKPMAPDEKGCLAIAEAAKASGKIFALGFVLRYGAFFRKYRAILQSGVIGKIITFRHIEEVGYWHQAHSFVRGNWSNEAKSSPMILAKCCHDLDILNYLTDSRCQRISSFGGLRFFCAENRPKKAADRCMDCPLAESCLYSAKKFYFGRLRTGQTDWPLDVITNDCTEGGVEKALREGPYGRCVFACDNNVVDHQVLDFEYDNGISGSMTMTAFSDRIRRLTEFRGTEGELYGDGSTITLRRFGSEQDVVYSVSNIGQDLAGGHGGGDGGLAKVFVEACRTNNQALLGATVDEMIAGHLMPFAAEKSRKSGRIVEL